MYRDGKLQSHWVIAIEKWKRSKIFAVFILLLLLPLFFTSSSSSPYSSSFCSSSPSNSSYLDLHVLNWANDATFHENWMHQGKWNLFLEVNILIVKQLLSFHNAKKYIHERLGNFLSDSFEYNIVKFSDVWLNFNFLVG